ncbi:hypothetical protein D9613_001842 [Agrocybe pediades]|uniref:Large ribosomal subunit protein bL32m n=1 Tax=Agrocybe pediades TaxID=84607 RepID=A0A8H4R640_9AGAR|nr:hypothetical protein D9613_001842 [Agrocybe pediades]
MATVLLRRTSASLTFLRPSLFANWLAPVATAAASLNVPRTTWNLPALGSLLELFPSIVLAVPKSKTSHSRKAMRSANKGLKDKRNITNCAGCGSVKLAHHICPNCYSQISRQFKDKKKESGDIIDLS